MVYLTYTNTYYYLLDFKASISALITEIPKTDFTGSRKKALTNARMNAYTNARVHVHFL